MDRKQIACEQTYDNKADNTCGQQRISAGFKIFRLVGCTLIDAVAGFIVQQLLSLRQRLLLDFLYFLYSAASSAAACSSDSTSVEPQSEQTV